MRRRTAFAGAAAGLAAAALVLGGAFRSGNPRAAEPPLGPKAPAAQSTVATVARLQAALTASPRSQKDWSQLGAAYEQRARETGDPSYYTKAGGALRQALKLNPEDPAATASLGSLALSRHRFRDALRLGRDALRLAPELAGPQAIVGDALVELGRYQGAFVAFDTFVRAKPGLAAYARVSYARELLGDTAGAVTAMRMAVDAATAEAEPSAWTRWQLGKLYWSTGRTMAAENEYRAALAIFPRYVYALDALAQARAANGNLSGAIDLEEQAANEVPLPQFVSSLGDLYRLAGRPKTAERQYGLIAVIDRLLVANGVRTDLETALFRVDHGIQLRKTVALARLAQRERPSIEGDDVLAWALARNGDCREALRYSRLALRLGTRDALKFFHRGMIERCLGNRATAQNWFRRALS